MRGFFREKELWLLVLLGVAYFFQPLFLGRTLFLRDLSMYFLPQKSILSALVGAGQLPLWNPFIQGGQGFSTSLASSILAPSNLLFLVLPLMRAFNLVVAIHFLLCLAGAYLLARVLGLARTSSVVVGLVFGFSGFTLSLVNLLNHFLAWSFLPLLLACWYLWSSLGRRRYFIASVVVAVAQLFSGSPEVSSLSFALLLGLGLLLDDPRRSRLRRVGGWLALVVFTLGIAAVQLLPTAEIVAASPRGFGMSFTDLSAWSLNPKRLPELLLPTLLGHVDRLDPDAYWGTRLVDDGFPYLISMYLGLVVLTLAAVGGFAGQGSPALSRRTRRFLLALLGLSLVLALGRFLPGAEQLSALIPLLSIFRYPSKLLALGVLPAALLAGWACESFFGGHAARAGMETSEAGERLGSPMMVVASWACLAFLSVAAAVTGLGTGGIDRFLAWWFEGPVTDVMRLGVAGSLTHAALTYVVLALLFTAVRRRRRSWYEWALVAVVAVDLASAGARINPSCPEHLLTEAPRAVTAVRSQIADGRLYVAPGPPGVALDAPVDDVAWKYRYNLEVLGSASASGFLVPVIFHPDVVQLAPISLMKLKLYLSRLPWEQRLPILAAAGVTLIATHEDLSLPELEAAGTIGNASDVPLRLYRHRTAAARAEVVTSWQWVATDEACLDVMRSPGFDPRRQVVLSGSAVDEIAAHQNAAAIISTRTPSNHRTELRVAGPVESFLVFSEPHYPGWRVEVDGQEAPIERANLAFSAVRLAPGEHVVVREYRPWSMVGGLVVSICCSIALVIFGWIGLMERRSGH